VGGAWDCIIKINGKRTQKSNLINTTASLTSYVWGLRDKIIGKEKHKITNLINTTITLTSYVWGVGL
jgi:hypothetical protein